MADWSTVSAQVPELAARVRARFEATGLGLLATLRRDGSPRISGIEPLFTDQHLWLGMMPDSRKALDLLRDPRFALHNATSDKEVKEGDVKINGRAILVEDEPTIAEFRRAFSEATGQDIGSLAVSLFRADVTDLSTVQPAGDHLN